MRMIHSGTKAEFNEDPLAYDFSQIDAEYSEDLQPLWMQYKQNCYSQVPPIPALSLMRPILEEGVAKADFQHQHIGVHLPIVLDVLARAKIISELNLRDNSLNASSVTPLIEFAAEAESLSILDLSDNPLIGPKPMTAILEGIKVCSTLEHLNISHTGCGKGNGPAVAHLMAECPLLEKLWLGNCSLGLSAGEVAQAIAAHPTLKKVKLSRNDLFVGGRRFAIQLGSNIGKSEKLRKINLSNNALTTEMVVAMLRGLVQSTTLRKLDLSRNNIGEPAGRPIAMFLTKAMELRKLYLDQNPLLNVTVNKISGQRRLEEDSKKPGGNKSKGPKVYTPGCYSILVALSKAAKIRKVRMIGLVVEQAEWMEKLSALTTAKPDLEVEYRAASDEHFQFRRARPQTAIPQGPPPPTSGQSGPGAGGASARNARK